MGNSIIDTTNAGRAAVDDLRVAVTERFASDVVKSPSDLAPSDAGSAFPNGVTIGGAALVYATILAHETGKDIDVAAIFGDTPASFYERTYLSALDDTGLITIKRHDHTVTVKSVKQVLINSKTYLRDRIYSTEELTEQHQNRIKKVDQYFGM